LLFLSKLSSVLEPATALLFDGGRLAQHFLSALRERMLWAYLSAVRPGRVRRVRQAAVTAAIETVPALMPKERMEMLPAKSKGIGRGQRAQACPIVDAHPEPKRVSINAQATNPDLT